MNTLNLATSIQYSSVGNIHTAAIVYRCYIYGDLDPSATKASLPPSCVTSFLNVPFGKLILDQKKN